MTFKGPFQPKPFYDSMTDNFAQTIWWEAERNWGLEVSNYDSRGSAWFPGLPQISFIG